MKGKQHRRKPMSEINVVPYIDVTLVLLIIFMITTPLLQTGVEVDLPQAEAKTIDQKEDLPLVVSIDATGQYFINIGGDEDEPIEPEQLTIQVAAVLRNKPATNVLVRGDKAVDYGKVVVVMSALKTAGVENIGLMTNPNQE